MIHTFSSSQNISTQKECLDQMAGNKYNYSFKDLLCFHSSYEKNERIIPFSIGKRNCMGELLARNEVFLFTVNLIQKIRFLPSVDKPKPNPANFSSSITNTASDFFVRFLPV
jgi:cytochrome P450